LLGIFGGAPGTAVDALEAAGVTPEHVREIVDKLKS